MNLSRRDFLKSSTAFTGAMLSADILTARPGRGNVRVSGHLWIYASKYPPDWDATPVLEQVFSDFTYAGIEGVEVMEVNLRHEDAVSNLRALSEKYRLPVTGCSYSGNMWDKTQHSRILDDVSLVVDRLYQLGGKNFGITVGNARRMKRDDELDAQADVLKRIMRICDDKRIVANLHNHTFEVENDMHDLKGTLARLPEVKLGPDLNWLIRGGIDPVSFIKTYGRSIVYMHIRDQTREGVWTEAVGEGVTDFPAIARALKEINYRGEAAIELAAHVPPKNDMKENWKKSRDYVKEVFGW